MALTQGTIIAERYALHDRLGTGAMGEVWRAQDTKFESRWVAVKFLREDETLKADAQNRERLIATLIQQEGRGPLTTAGAFDAIGSALSTSNGDGLRDKLRIRFPDGVVTAATVTALFDELVVDPAFNDNARVRAKLRRLFRDEANAVANLRHDNIVSIFDYGDHDGSPYLVMDYIEGRTLHQVVEGQEPLSQSRRLRLMEDLCAGLGYAHKRKLVHRDIKPANLIIDSSTNSLKILDFGVVRRLGTDSTVGIPIGTFCYMSPEQTKGAATLDQRSDIFAVGLVFYELMGGKKAFPPGRGVGDLVGRIQREPPPSLRQLAPTLPPVVEDIITKAIAKRPDDRYQDLTVMERDIAKVRAKIEAEDGSERTKFGGIDEPTLVKARQPNRPGAELVQTAERAFAAGDDNAVVELCNRALAVNPSLASAAALRSQAEGRLRQARAKGLLQQAEKFLVLDDLRSAQTSIEQARELTPSDPALLALDQKVQTAIAVRSRPAPPPPAPAPPSAPPPAPVSPPIDPSVPRPVSGVRQPAGRVELPPVAPVELLPPSRQVQKPPVPAPVAPPPPPAPAPLPIDPDAIEQTVQVMRPPEGFLDIPTPIPSRPTPTRRDLPAAPKTEMRPPAAHQSDVTLRNVPSPVADAPRGGMPGAGIPPPSVTAASASAAGVAPAGTRPPVAPAPVPAPPGPSVPPAPPAPSKVSKPAAPRPPAPPAPPPSGKAQGGSQGAPPAFRPASNPLPLLGGVAVVLFLAIVAWVAFRPTSNGGDVTSVVSSSVAPTTAPVTSTVPTDPNANTGPPGVATTTTIEVVDPIAPGGTLARYTIDLRPWARVRIVPSPPAPGQPAPAPPPGLPTEPQLTPFTVDLPPGDYILEAENGGITRPQSFPLKAAIPADGRTQFFTRPMPGFNPASLLDQLMKQQ